METSQYHFCIADHHLSISFVESEFNGIYLLPSFKPFVSNEDSGQRLFHLTVDDSLQPIDKSRRERIRTFDTGNGDTVVDLIDDGGYQFIIKDINGRDCCLLQSNKNFDECSCALNGNFNMRSFGLNNAIMLIYAFAGCRKDTLLIHASLVRQNGYGYAFTAKSGTGKSTQVSMWLRHLPGCDLMNDDNPIVRLDENGEAWIYGGPWSGKTPCYRNVKARLGAITHIARAPENSIERLSPIDAFAKLLPACSSMKWDKDIFNYICDTVTKIIETTGIYTLHCLPNKEAAEICNKEISK